MPLRAEVISRQSCGGSPRSAEDNFPTATHPHPAPSSGRAGSQSTPISTSSFVSAFTSVRQSGFCQNALEPPAGRLRAHPLPHNDGVGFPKRPHSSLQGPLPHIHFGKSCAIRESLAFCATCCIPLRRARNFSAPRRRRAAFFEIKRFISRKTDNSGHLCSRIKLK